MAVQGNQRLSARLQPGDLILDTSSFAALCERVLRVTQRLLPASARQGELSARLRQPQLPEPAMVSLCVRGGISYFWQQRSRPSNIVPPSIVEQQINPSAHTGRWPVDGSRDYARFLC